MKPGIIAFLLCLVSSKVQCQDSTFTSIKSVIEHHLREVRKYNLNQKIVFQIKFTHLRIDSATAYAADNYDVCSIRKKERLSLVKFEIMEKDQQIEVTATNFDIYKKSRRGIVLNNKHQSRIYILRLE